MQLVLLLYCQGFDLSQSIKQVEFFAGNHEVTKAAWSCRKVVRRRVGAACEQPVVADRSRAAATHRRATSLFGESEVPLISRKAARSRVEVEIIDVELEMIWLTEVDEGEDHGNEEGLNALCDIEPLARIPRTTCSSHFGLLLTKPRELWQRGSCTCVRVAIALRLQMCSGSDGGGTSGNDINKQ